jgi:hypothetical protein
MTDVSCARRRRPIDPDEVRRDQGGTADHRACLRAEAAGRAVTISRILLISVLWSCIPDDVVEDPPRLDTSSVSGVYGVILTAPDPSLTCRQLTVSVGTDAISWSGCLRGGEGAFTATRDTLTLADTTGAPLYRFTGFSGPSERFVSDFSGPCTGTLVDAGLRCDGSATWSRQLP